MLQWATQILNRGVEKGMTMSLRQVQGLELHDACWIRLVRYYWSRQINRQN